MTQGRHVFLATPTHDGSVRAEYTDALFRSVGLLGQKGVNVTLSFLIGNALVHDARNRLVSQFLASGADTLVFIDADIAWEPEGLLKLVLSPHDVIGGAYRQKRDDAELYNLGDPAPGPTRLVACRYIGTGFLKVSRRAIEKICEAFPIKYGDDRGNEVPAIFDTEMVDGKLTGEDALFCRRWIETGGKVFCDPDLVLWHFGTKAYGGHFATLITRAEQNMQSAQERAEAPEAA